MKQRIKLRSIIQQVRGVSYKPIDIKAAGDPDAIALLRANNIQDDGLNFEDLIFIDKKKVRSNQMILKGDILICTSSGSKNLVGKAVIADRDLPCTFGAFCKIVRVKAMDAAFVGHFFQSPRYRREISKASAGANINNIRNEHIDDMEILVYSDAEQHRIAVVLDKVSDLIAKHRQQLDKLDELVKSRFIKMFGDPVLNPFEWSTRPLLEMGYCKNGMNFHTGDRGIEMHCLGVGDFKEYSVIDGTDHLPIVSLNEVPSEESMLQDGDIVFVRSNGNKALVGRCLVVYPRSTPTTYSGFCIRYRLTGDEVNTAYLLRVLKTDSMRERMAGRGANIQNLNQQILATLEIPTPPMRLQEQFAAFVAQTDKSKLAIKQSLEKLETLKKSLLQKYFG